MNKLILLSGKAQNGKTTMANIMKKQLESKGYHVVITQYAYYIKDLAKRYLSWNGLKDDKGRELLQTLGTSVIRQKLNKPNFHVGRICEDIEICQDCVDYVIVDDARFLNEIYYPKAMFGEKVISVRINRINSDGTKYISSLTKEQQEHISEIELDEFNFDFTITASNIEELEHCAVELIADIEKE